MTNEFKSGFVSIIGQPNVGKSTLMNHFIGMKIAITSNKPQTTRNKIQALITDQQSQIIFIDTPGIHNPTTKLGERMVKSAQSSLSEVDCVLFVVTPNKFVSEVEKTLAEKLKKLKCPVVLVINKVDTIQRAEIMAVIDKYSKLLDFTEIIPISALKGENTDKLLTEIKKNLKPGPKYFPDDFITDQPEKQIAAELIREKTLLLLQDEIPHGIAVEIMTMKKRSDKSLVDIEATIYCERDSHKGIVIGKKGDMLKKIGVRAREDIERILGSKVNLQLWVRVKKNWRDSDFLIKNFGLDVNK